jgi:hypothetical protein
MKIANVRLMYIRYPGHPSPITIAARPQSHTRMRVKIINRDPRVQHAPKKEFACLAVPYSVASPPILLFSSILILTLGWYDKFLATRPSQSDLQIHVDEFMRKFDAAEKLVQLSSIIRLKISFTRLFSKRRPIRMHSPSHKRTVMASSLSSVSAAQQMSPRSVIQSQNQINRIYYSKIHPDLFILLIAKSHTLEGMLQKNSPSGNRTRVTRVTGGYTHLYTKEDMLFCIYLHLYYI